MENNKDKKTDDILEKLVHINRITKVVKGGRRFGFAALVVVGDMRGRVGFGTGKAKEVPEAIKKATDDAKKKMIRVPLKEGRTLHHDMKGHYGAGRVVLRSAPPGTGIIAGGPMRAVFETLGVQDVVAKSVGTSILIIWLRQLLKLFHLWIHQEVSHLKEEKKCQIFLELKKIIIKIDDKWYE